MGHHQGVTDTAPAPGHARGMVIAGAILVGAYLVPAVALIGWFLWGLLTASEAMSMVFVFWLLALMALTPAWVIGILLLGVGRARQRGRVAGAPAAWVLAVGGLPAVGALLALAVVLAGSQSEGVASASFVALAVGIPLLCLLAFLSGAWLTWGRTRVA